MSLNQLFWATVALAVVSLGLVAWYRWRYWTDYLRGRDARRHGHPVNTNWTNGMKQGWADQFRADLFR